MQPIKHKNGHLITFDYAKAFSRLTRSELNSLIGFIQIDYNLFISSDSEVTITSNKEFIVFYEFWKSKIEELKYRENVTYTLSVVKNRESSPTILAKVKWNYKLCLENFYYIINHKMPLIIVVGIPCAGKTTISNQIKKFLEEERKLEV